MKTEKSNGKAITHALRVELRPDQKWAVMEVLGTGCPRCGKAHKTVKVKKFANPPAYTMPADEKRYLVDGWGICPTLKEPILFVRNLEVRAK